MDFQFSLASSIKIALFSLSICVSSEEQTEFRKFGSGIQGPPVKEVMGFLLPMEFYHGHILESQPLKMVGAAMHSPAFMKWQDDYFLSLNVPADNSMTVETKKKEDRKQHTLDMNFKDFVHIYNKSDQYMVNPVPSFLSQDIVIPGPLQCDDLISDAIVEAMMWFSSGGTKSVVHTDSVENINCLYSGEKEFVMVNPHLYGHLVDLDHPEGAYSGIDVDRVDMDKYPGLAEVEYQHVQMKAGDCLYIPYKWIHQVRSYNRNIAVNIWWDHVKNSVIDWEGCPKSFNPHLTLDVAGRAGFEILEDVHELKEIVLSLLEQKDSFDLDELIKLFLSQLGVDMEQLSAMNAGRGYTIPVSRAFRIMDVDENGTVTVEEVNNLSEGNWLEVDAEVANLEAILARLEELNDADSLHRDEL